MRILYLSLSYIPSRRASSVQVMRMCDALARQGHEVTLVSKGCAVRQEEGVTDDHAFYGVHSRFEIVKLPRPAWRGGGLIYFLATLGLLLRRRVADLVYCRDLWGAWLATRLRRPVLFEAHGIPTNRLGHHLLSRVLAAPSFLRLVVISAALRRLLQEMGLQPHSEADLVVAHDAAEPARPPDAGAIAGEVDEGRPNVGYVGHLYPGRGVELTMELARRLPACSFHLVGGAERDLERWRSRGTSPNVELHGFVSPGELGTYYERFDLLLMPYQRQVGVAGGKTDTSAWMSPMKMFEYMAAGKPILASDLPVLREILRHEHNALLLPPSDVESWEAAIRRVIGDPRTASRLGTAARADFLASHTWEARAGVVLRGLPAHA